MNKSKVILSAILVIALCASLVCGATFALFTSESKVNIAVTSGKVAVTAVVDGDLTLSHQEADAAEASGYKTVEGSLYSGKAELDADKQTVNISNMVPMDKIEFDIKVTNDSNVKIQYRTVIKAIDDDGLFAGLKITVGSDEFNGTTVRTAYAQYAVGEGNQTIHVTIELPQEAGNDYQGKTCKLQYCVEAYQGNAKILSDPVEASATIEKDSENKVVAQVEIKSVDKVEDGSASLATAVVPAEAKVDENATELVLKVEETADANPANIAVSSDESVANFEIKLEGLASDNDKAVVVKYFIAKNLTNFSLYHSGKPMTAVTTSADDVDEDNEYYYDIDSGIVTMAVKSFSPFTYTYNAASTAVVAELKRITTEYGSDGLKMPAGVKITSLGNEDNHFEIVLEDEEAFLYFTQVFDRAAAYEARKTALENGEITKYPAEKGSTYNMWWGAYTSGITVKMGCDVDLKGITVSTVKFGGSYGPNFDGCGHTISNAKMSGTSGYVGFFCGNISVSNVTFDNFTISATGCEGASVVCGLASGAMSISGVTVKNSTITGAKYTGAIIGYGSGKINMTDCTVENTVVCGQYKVGGAVGYICCCDSSDYNVQITGNTLTDVTVKGENVWTGKTQFVLGKVVGNWCVPNGACKNNTFTGTTDATDFIGQKNNVVAIDEGTAD